MVYISIDIALRKTGYAVISYHKGKYSIVESGCQYTKDKDLYTSIVKIYDDFSHIFNKYKEYHEDVVVIVEGALKSGFSGATLRKLESARTALYLSYWHTLPSMEFTVVDPQSVKHYFTGMNGAKKPVVHKVLKPRIKDVCGLDIHNETQEDVLDAYSIFLYYIEKERNKKV